MSNKHIFDYLDYYVDLSEPPRYAIMLTGPWGTGKSYGVKQYLKTLKDRGKKFAYVSLYGVKSSDEIAIAILTALAPRQDGKLVRIGSQIGRVLWRTLPMKDAGASLAELIPEDWCDLIVLDDLERAILSPAEVLAFVNAFIEHEERRVVIIANEKELADRDNYLRIREKVIGMTFEFVEQSKEVLAHFIESTGDEATRALFKRASNVVLQVFAQSNTHNLRILEQSLRSWERMFKITAPDLKKKEKGIVAALKLFLALSLEVRAGRLGREDLTDRVSKVVSGNMSKRDGKNAKGTPLSEAQERYERLYLHDNILSDDVLAKVLCDGRIDAEAINACLSVHPLFVEPDEEPNWRKVWHGLLRDAQDFDEAFKGVEREFAERTHDDPGVVLHVMGMRLWGAEIGQLPQGESQIVAECKAYVDDLRRSGRLPRYEPRGFRDAAHGLAFHSSEKRTFKELLEYYTQQSELAYQDTWPHLAESLLADMSGDGEGFYRRVYWAQGGKPDCADDPILARITPASFVDKFLSCNPEAQRTILEALKARYETGRMQQPLAAECPWIIGVHDELQRRMPDLQPIRRYSVSNDTERLLGSALQAARRLVSAAPRTSC